MKNDKTSDTIVVLASNEVGETLAVRYTGDSEPVVGILTPADPSSSEEVLYLTAKADHPGVYEVRSSTSSRPATKNYRDGWSNIWGNKSQSN